MGGIDKSEPRDRLSANLRQELLGWIFPRLAELPPVQREDALKKARDTPFDLMESVGIGGAAALVAGILQAVPLEPNGDFLKAYLGQLLFALPLLVVTSSATGKTASQRNTQAIERSAISPASAHSGERIGRTHSSLACFAGPPAAACCCPTRDTWFPG